MNTFSKIAVTSITGIALAVSVISPAYAWHPEGKIVKSVRNVTANGELKDANNADNAVNAKIGDTLQYSITVSNVAKPAEKNYNDMAFVILKDTLPDGVELIDNASNVAQRQITENIGTVLPGKSVTKQYTVRVTSTSSAKLIENKACFEGDSVVKDKPQRGCDSAFAKVSVQVVPAAPVAHAPTPVAPAVLATPVTAPVATPTPTTVAAKPEVLPATGPGALAVASFAGLSSLGYAVNMFRLRRRA